MTAPGAPSPARTGRPVTGPDRTPVSGARLLFVTPEPPSATGGGLAMRAGSVLGALAGAGWEVHVLVVPVHGDRPDDGGPLVTRFAAAYDVLDLDGLAPGSRRQAALDVLGDPALRLALTATSPRPAPCRQLGGAVVRAVTDRALGMGREAGRSFDAVHVLRLYLAPVLDALLARPGRPQITLDVDEDDATVARQLHALGRAGARGGLVLADLPDPGEDAGDAPAYERLQRWYLPRVDRVAVASADEAGRLEVRSGLAPGTIVVVPNEVPAGAGTPGPEAQGTADVPAEPGSPGTGTGTSTGTGTTDLLLVGNFSWPPNADAAVVLCERVRPALADALGRPVTVALVGKDPPPEVRRLGGTAGVTVTGFVDDVGPYYAAAGVAAVPMRAGGGSRIKILEAMDRGVPVVTTEAGAAGLDAGSTPPPVVVARSVEAFVDGCRLVLDDAAWRARTVRAARLWVQGHHGPPAVATAMGALLGSPGRRLPRPAGRRGSDDG